MATYDASSVAGTFYNQARAAFFAQPAYRLRRRARERAAFVESVAAHGGTVGQTVSAETACALGGMHCNLGGRS